MDRDSDHVDDPGRRDSEKRLSSSSSFVKIDQLHKEVVEALERSYRDAVATIMQASVDRDLERKNKEGFYSSLNMQDDPEKTPRPSYKLPYQARTSAETAEAEAREWKGFLQAREKDKEELKELLAKGKRIAEGETGAVGDDGVEGKGKEGSVGGEGGRGEVAGVLKGVLKGGKKWTEGLE